MSNLFFYFFYYKLLNSLDDSCVQVSDNTMKKEKLKYINFRRKICSYYFLFLEMLAILLKLFNKHLIQYRNRIVSEELKITKISPDDELLFIGCGLFPSTPMLLAERTNAKTIIAIDNKRAIAKLAKLYISKKNFLARIKIEYGDGASYPVENFDVIFMATNIYPIESILRRLCSHMKPNAQLICRDIKNDIENVLEKEGLSNKFSIESLSEHPAGLNYKSILLIKNEL